MKLGEFKIIGQGMFAALVTPRDELHPEVPLVLIGDDAKYMYFHYLLRKGSRSTNAMDFIAQFEQTERFRRNRAFYLWLRDTVARRELTNINTEPRTATGQKGNGAR